MTKPKRVFGECVYCIAVDCGIAHCNWAMKRECPPGLKRVRYMIEGECACCPCFEKREEKK